jgi:murein DD-endopeptidase MepM/ murein hydrolase activator NlpD
MSFDQRIPSIFFTIIVSGALLFGCAAPTPVVQPTSTAPQATQTLPQVPMSSATPTLTAQPTLAPTDTTTPSAKVCSPLPGYALADLPGMIFNPYHPPAPGLDDPHEGIDLAVVEPGSQIALAGHPVAAALTGRVASLIANRFPYGNAVFIETPLEQIRSGLAIPTPAPTLIPRSALTCPPFSSFPTFDPSHRSIYTVYAHLQELPPLQVGQTLSCGETFGKVGSTGNALNPHLHFEVRVGPAGATFSSMAHYDSSATAEEMSNYCLWRVSGVFQLFNPLTILNQP